MAHSLGHIRNDSGVSVHSFIVHDQSPPSPTLTNPDMIIPLEPWQRNSSFDYSNQGPHPLLEPQTRVAHPTSKASGSAAGNSMRDRGLASAAPGATHHLVTTRRPTSIQATASSSQLYTGYEHGAPLSDIYEESEANATPKSVRRRTPSPPEDDSDDRGSTTPTRLSLRQKKRISSLSASSSTGSDLGDWENFDSSKVLSTRAAADLAQMKRDDTLEVEEDSTASKRQSREEEELAALNARAEKILEHARQRLTNMEDNLKTARNSIFMPTPGSATRSPNLGGEHQPVGGLYRSISAAGATKLGARKQGILPIRTSASLQHMRGGSDTGLTSATKGLTRLPDVRSASALEYGSPGRYSLFPDLNQATPASKIQPSPASSRSYTSPLRPLKEELDSPSTAETTPESVKAPLMRGLGINSAAAMSRENLVAPIERPTISRHSSTPGQLARSTSSTSNRSTKELKEQMTDLKTRIADLRSKAQAESLRRRSLQSLRSSSPFASAAPEGWYASSPSYQDNTSPININAGVGQTSPAPAAFSQSGFHVQNYDGQTSPAPITPANARFLDVDQMTPDTEARMLSSARTDRNTPSLARKRNFLGEEDDEYNEQATGNSEMQFSQYEDALDAMEDDDSEDTERIAENEEEQIYLNEMLEESLREAEVEPEVPAIPGSFLESPDGILGPEAQRHEDRLDAFDYENMFLHSAMGNYTGKSINGSDSGSEDDSDDNGSVETSRQDARTPVEDDGLAGRETDVEPVAHEEPENVMSEEKFQYLPQRSTPGAEHSESGQKHSQGLPQMELPEPPKPWMHARSKSMESSGTSATFETATEGYEDYDDETPNEILNWDLAPSSNFTQSPTSYQAYRGNHDSPLRPRHGFSSPQGGGRSSPLAIRSPGFTSPLRQQQGHYEIVHDHEKALGSPGLGLGVVGAENAQYINDNGIPERFQIRPLPTHSRNESGASLQQRKFRPDSQATIIAASPGKVYPRGHQRQQSSLAMRSPLTANNINPNTGSPVIVTVTSSPQRKVVINRALQRPGSYQIEPQMSTPPDVPLPPPPASSAALQAQMGSPKKINIKSFKQNATQKRSPPQLQHPSLQQSGSLKRPADPRDTTTIPTPNTTPMPNTEILMESLIKLADPSFSLAPGIRFAEVDKGLVLGLLGAVGGVCNNILTASVQAGSPALGKTQAENLIGILRGRLDSAKGILEGFDEGEERVS